MAASPGWQSALLTALHAPATPANLQFLNAWQRAEGGSAAYNPFNTTQSAPGASSYNPVGVRNYPSEQAGIQATVQTLLNGRYAPIVTGLRSGHESARQLAEAVAASPWGTGQGVLRVLGSSPAAAGGAPASPSPAAVAPTPTPAVAAPSLGIPLEVQQILNQNNERAGIAPVNYGAIPSTPAVAQPRNTPAAAPAPAAHPSMGVKYTGTSLTGVKQPFLNKVTSAARAQGATKIRVISGYRSPSYNAKVGGVPRSNHMTGDAIDAQGYVPGRGWVPLGTLLKPVAGKYGLRSGDQPGFYHGGTDPNHVDDGANQH